MYRWILISYLTVYLIIGILLLNSSDLIWEEFFCEEESFVISFIIFHLPLFFLFYSKPENISHEKVTMAFVILISFFIIIKESDAIINGIINPLALVGFGHSYFAFTFLLKNYNMHETKQN